MTDEQAPIGVICALAAEAATLSARARPDTSVREGRLLVHLCGIGQDNAAAAARVLVGEGAGALVSWGTAGALGPGLPGDAVLPATIVHDDGARLDTDPHWRAALAAVLQGPANGDCLLSSERPVRTPEDRRRLHAELGAGAVDMESWAIGCVAREAGLPFIAVRVIADAAGATIPGVALRGVDRYGRPQGFRLLGGLLRQPGALVHLLRLSRAFGQALKTLRVIAATAGPGLRLPATT